MQETSKAASEILAMILQDSYKIGKLPSPGIMVRFIITQKFCNVLSEMSGLEK